ncbi:MAG TPA: SRPBCC family protein [Solirubrobacteraceae bacterium]|nr:SRPBCC family protein [Solirubrobacteraceae bacterium]
MKLEQSFQVEAPIEQVWEALIDLERVAPCLPGAAITERDDDGTYHGTFQVRLGPTTASYRGTIRIEEADEAARAATLKARGTDKRGQGGASATIVNRLVEADGGTRVDATTDFTITGRLARFGRGGMIEDISNRMLRDFATCLQTRLAEGPAPSGPPSGADIASGEAPPEAAATPPSAPAVPASAPAAPAPPVKGFSLLASVLWERLRRLLGRRRN